MAKLGSKKRHAVVRVHTEEKTQEILALCNKHGWQVIVGIENDKPEDITDVERLLNPDKKIPKPALNHFPAPNRAQCSLYVREWLKI